MKLTTLNETFRWYLVYSQCRATTTLVPKHYHHLQRKLHTLNSSFTCLLPKCQPLSTCCLSPRIHLLWIFHTNGIIKYATVCDWLLSLASYFWGSSMLSRKSLVPFHGWIIFHHGNKWNLLIHSSVYGYRQFASFSYYEHCCSEHVCTCLSMEGFWVVKWHFLICIIVGALWLLCWKETERGTRVPG